MQSIDTQWFLWINQLDVPATVDTILLYWRNASTWLPLYVLLILGITIRFKRKGVLIVLFAIATAGVSDLTTSRLLKPAFERPRPCHTLSEDDGLMLKVKCGRGHSMPSAHAANHFSLALFLLLSLGQRLRVLTGGLILWAIIVGFAQIYVGVHYPFDILAGFIWGSMLALSFYRLYLSVMSVTVKGSSSDRI